MKTLDQIDDILAYLENIRIVVSAELPEKHVQPWPGHSPAECALLNVLSGLLITAANLKKYRKLCL